MVVIGQIQMTLILETHSYLVESLILLPKSCIGPTDASATIALTVSHEVKYQRCLKEFLQSDWNLLLPHSVVLRCIQIWNVKEYQDLTLLKISKREWSKVPIIIHWTDRQWRHVNFFNWCLTNIGHDWVFLPLLKAIVDHNCRKDNAKYDNEPPNGFSSAWSRSEPKIGAMDGGRCAELLKELSIGCTCFN